MRSIILIILKLISVSNNKLIIIKSKYLKKLFRSCMGTPYISKGCQIKGFEFISIGENCVLSDFVRVHAWAEYRNKKFTPNIKIGKNFFINNNSYITCCNSINIGNNVLCGSNVFISDNSHGNIALFNSEVNIEPINRDLYSKGKIIIGNNVWIGQNVVILANVEIGDNCIIAANSVVNASFPSNALIAGNPAKLIKILK